MFIERFKRPLVFLVVMVVTAAAINVVHTQRLKHAQRDNELKIERLRGDLETRIKLNEDKNAQELKNKQDAINELQRQNEELKQRVEAKKKILPGATAQASAPTQNIITGSTVWDRLANCESSQNWAYNGPSGYDGGLQFSPSTWISNGGYEFSSEAWQATREQQIIVAERLRAARGYAPWPACARSLGLL